MKVIEIDSLGPVEFHKNPRAKHYRITLKPGRKVRVTVPRLGTFGQAEKFVWSKQAWIEKKLAEKPKFEPLPASEIARLRAEAKAYIPERVNILADRHGLNFNQVRIKNMTSRWGSCSSKKNLNFSLYLMGLESKYVDYVILHELAHTKQMNHGPKFWALLEEICPGAKALDREMRVFGMTVG